SRRTRPGATMGRAAEDLPDDRPDRRDPAAPDPGRGLRPCPRVALLADRATAAGGAIERYRAAVAATRRRAATQRPTAPRRPRPADERLARAAVVPAPRASPRPGPQPRGDCRRARPAGDRDLLLPPSDARRRHSADPLVERLAGDHHRHRRAHRPARAGPALTSQAARAIHR